MFNERIKLEFHMKPAHNTQSGGPSGRRSDRMDKSKDKEFVKGRDKEREIEKEKDKKSINRRPPNRGETPKIEQEKVESA